MVNEKKDSPNQKSFLFKNKKYYNKNKCYLTVFGMFQNFEEMN